MYWDWEYTLDILPTIVRAFGTTLVITVVSMVGALLLGIVFAATRLGAPEFIARPLVFVTDFIRGTPLFVQLLILYFGLPAMGWMASPMLIGLVALAVHYSTYTSEVYLAGFKAVPKPLQEAGVALSLKKSQRFRFITLPAALPKITAPLGSYAILMLKDTPVLAAITVAEVLQRAESIASQTYRYVEPFTIVALLFFIVGYIASILIRHTERKVGYVS